MNVKFVLFIIVSLASLVMMYMWFTMSREVSNSHVIEEQYFYRISSLKTEIEIERNLIENLRRDAKINGKNYREKSLILETMKQKQSAHDKERLRLEKETQNLTQDYDKVSKSNEELIRKMKSEAEAKESDDNEEIENLTNELKKLESNRNDLLKSMDKYEKNVEKSGEFEAIIQDKHNGVVKPPKINKGLNNVKEINDKQNPIRKGNQTGVTTTKAFHQQPNENNNKLKSENEVSREESIKKDTGDSNAVGPKIKADKYLRTNVDLKTKLVSNKPVGLKESPDKKDKDNESQLEPPAGLRNDDDDTKNDVFNRNPQNPKILFKRDQQQQVNAPNKHLKYVNGFAKNQQSNDEANYQVRLPRNEQTINQNRAGKISDKSWMRDELANDER